MPIHHVGKTTQIDCGFGDVGVGPALTEPTFEGEQPLGAVVFFETNPQEIGNVNNYKEPMTLGKQETPVRIIFHKVESIDVLIRSLEMAKAMMLSGKLEDGINDAN